MLPALRYALISRRKTSLARMRVERDDAAGRAGSDEPGGVPAAVQRTGIDHRGSDDAGESGGTERRCAVDVGSVRRPGDTTSLNLDIEAGYVHQAI